MSLILGNFLNGVVRSDGNWIPSAGEKVRLMLEGNSLMVLEADSAEGIEFTWPLGDQKTASSKAVQFYYKKTNQKPF